MDTRLKKEERRERGKMQMYRSGLGEGPRTIRSADGMRGEGRPSESETTEAVVSRGRVSMCVDGGGCLSLDLVQTGQHYSRYHTSTRTEKKKRKPNKGAKRFSELHSGRGEGESVRK